MAGPLVVLAASSLGEVFGEIEAAFETEHPEVDVQLQLGSSHALARHVADGAPADVLVTADRRSIEEVSTLVDSQTTFARNRLEILVETGNPMGIDSVADLGRSGVEVVLCASEVPCGRLADAILRRANVTVRPASREENVTAVASKVTLGEADAGIVYVTDVRAAGDKAEGVAIDVADDPALQAVYLAAPVLASQRGELARRWVEFLSTPDSRRILSAAGFLPTS